MLEERKEERPEWQGKREHRATVITKIEKIPFKTLRTLFF